jgi:release factor glutamine methyltransferase
VTLNGPETLTVGQALTLCTSFLAKKGSPSARLDAQILTAHVLGLRRLDLYLAPDRPLSPVERDTLRALMVRRGQSEPVAYIVGHREFFGLDFKVTPDVLIPRPETESIVDAALAFLAPLPGSSGTAPLVADIGTGSGAIACTLAERDERLRVLASDISAGALAVARENAAALGVGDRIEFVQSDLFASIPTNLSFDLVVSNPPYIGESEAGMVDLPAIRYEPHTALFSGPDGTDVTYRLIEQASAVLRDGGALIVEIGTPAQQALVAARMTGFFETVIEIPDPAGIARGLMARDSHRQTHQGAQK